MYSNVYSNYTAICGWPVLVINIHMVYDDIVFLIISIYLGRRHPYQNYNVVHIVEFYPHAYFTYMYGEIAIKRRLTGNN